ncbi:kinase-like domain-containing protein [Aspergillus crustosus]
MSYQEIDEFLPSPAPIFRNGVGVPAHLVEKIDDHGTYHRGGQNPVYLGEFLGEHGRYQVVHKLRGGGSGNVWLCRDTKYASPTYVAIKIIIAELRQGNEYKRLMQLNILSINNANVAKYLLTPWKHFEHSGPNGRHDCFVFPVFEGGHLGNFCARVHHPPSFLRGLARESTDFYPGNILIGRMGPNGRPDGLDGKSEEYILQRQRGPIRVVTYYYHDPTDAAEPPYLVLNRRPEELNLITGSSQICVANFADTVGHADPPGNGSSIPRDYAAPETVLDLGLDYQFGFASDIWSLALTLLTIRRVGPATPFSADSQLSYLGSLVHTLGTPPGPLYSEWYEEWKGSEEHLEDEPFPLHDFLRVSLGSAGGDRVCTPGTSYWAEPVPEDERALLEDLVRKMLHYLPEERPSIDEVLAHPWFSYGQE